MIKRPKPTDTEQEILTMQNEFLSEKSKNASFQPAAKLVKFDKSKGLSQFAQRRAEYHKKIHSQASPSAAIEQTTKKEETPPIRFILGNIVERKEGGAVQSMKDDGDQWEGFPKPSRIDKNIKLSPSTKKSLFAMTQQTKTAVPSEDPQPNRSGDGNFDFGTDSIMLDNAEAQAIHKENAEFLKNCGEDEILKEQQRLLGSLDSSLVKFLQEKRKKKLVKIDEAPTPAKDVEMSEAPRPAPELDVLKSDASKNWLHFDVIETDKLEWMRDLPATMPELKPGESYEARFDWKGVLLPFRLAANESTSSELFLHGDDAHRPGYTMQELFRLARSTVMQQRLSALGSIGGILSIYNQGYYDGIFELPISKIFFLLRYAFDDNSPAMLEVTAKALATLLYNETDEILLDTTFDCSLDFIEPTLELPHENESDNSTESDELSGQFAKMNLKSNLCEAKVNDDEHHLSSLNDFHLAETDLINCLLRTNILQRINYILTTLNLENSTNLSCIKMLIRLARTSKAVAEKIVGHGDLLKSILEQFSRIPQTTDIVTIRILNATKVVSLKLFRVICAYDGGVFVDRLRAIGLDAILKNCIFVQENGVTVETVKLQIEAMRCTKIITVNTKSDSLFDEILPALQYTLEWLYQFVIFESEEHFLFRQCASALIALLGARNSISVACEKLPLCFSKWFMAAAKYPNLELSQITLLATCLNAINIPERFGEFLQIYFSKFLGSTTYLALCQSLAKSSGVLSSLRQRQQDHKPLPHLHSIVFNARNTPVFIVSEKPTIYLLSSIVRLFNDSMKNTKSPICNADWLNDGLIGYIERFARNISWSFSMNWFLRREVTFVLDALRSSAFQQRIDKSLQLMTAYKILCCLDDSQLNDILHIFSRFIFNIDLYENKMNVTSMDEWKSLYAKVCVEHYLNSLNQEGLPSQSFYDKEPMLSIDWPCMLLLKMYKTPDSFRAFSLPERDTICTTLAFLSLQNANDIKILTKTEQFLYTMVAYLGKENTFLDPDVNQLLTKFVRDTFTDPKAFDFDANLNQKFNFENLYISFLDQFQGCSYGDKTFGAMVMVPLAQKHNIKWRHMLWSEHVHVLRFVACTEAELIGALDDYLNPPECDKILLKSYYQAIHSRILLPNTIPYIIAEHHVNAYKTKLNQRTGTVAEQRGNNDE